jgi:curved DNA-binding protein CbpA
MNPYEILGVPSSASLEDIKQAWRRLARIHHPDRKGGSIDRMAEINKAYNALQDVAWRARYDETGETKAPLPIEIEARSCVMQLLMGVLQNEYEVPLYKGVMDLFSMNINEATNRSQQFDRKIKKMDRQRKGLKLTPSGKDTLSTLFQQLSDGYMEEKAKLDRQLEILDAGKKLFKDLASEANDAGALMDAVKSLKAAP